MLLNLDYREKLKDLPKSHHHLLTFYIFNDDVVNKKLPPTSTEILDVQVIQNEEQAYNQLTLPHSK